MSMKLSREEYLWQLEQLLYRVPAEEREEALEYYRSYFEEAGSENEEQVMKELGRPEDLAKSIWENVLDTGKHDTVKDSLVRRDTKERDRQSEWNESYREPEWGEVRSSDFDCGTAPETRRQGKGINIGVLVLLFFTAPIWGGIAIAVIATVMGLVIGLAGMAIGLVAALFALILVLILGGLTAIVKAFMMIVFTPVASGFALCLGAVMIAGGILVALLVGKLIGGFLKGIFTLLGKIIGTFFRIIGNIFRAIAGA